MDIKRGDIFLADLSMFMNSEAKTSLQRGLRPVIITSNSLCNKYSPIITVVPITSQKGKNNLDTHVHISKESGLLCDSIALVEAVRDLDKAALKRKVGAVSSDEMKQIEVAAQIQIGIVDPFNISHVNNLVYMMFEFISEVEGGVHNDLVNNIVAELRNYCSKYGVDYKNILNKRMKGKYLEVKVGAL